MRDFKMTPHQTNTSNPVDFPKPDMTREDILRMAREAGFRKLEEGEGATPWYRFAILVAAAEREACAKILDGNRSMCQPNGMLDIVLSANAAAIRARGEKND